MSDFQVIPVSGRFDLLEMSILAEKGEGELWINVMRLPIIGWHPTESYFEPVTPGGVYVKPDLDRRTVGVDVLLCDMETETAYFDDMAGNVIDRDDVVDYMIGQAEESLHWSKWIDGGDYTTLRMDSCSFLGAPGFRFDIDNLGKMDGKYFFREQG